MGVITLMLKQIPILHKINMIGHNKFYTKKVVCYFFGTLCTVGVAVKHLQRTIQDTLCTTIMVKMSSLCSIS